MLTSDMSADLFTFQTMYTVYIKWHLITHVISSYLHIQTYIYIYTKLPTLTMHYIFKMCNIISLTRFIRTIEKQQQHAKSRTIQKEINQEGTHHSEILWNNSQEMAELSCATAWSIQLWTILDCYFLQPENHRVVWLIFIDHFVFTFVWLSFFLNVVNFGQQWPLPMNAIAFVFVFVQRIFFLIAVYIIVFWRVSRHWCLCVIIRWKKN